MFLSTKVAAKLLATTPETITQHARYCRLPRRRVGRHWQYHVLDLVALYVFMLMHNANGKYIPWHEHKNTMPDLARQTEIDKLARRIEADQARLKQLQEKLQ